MLSKVIDSKSCYNLDNRNMLREVIVKISFERIDIQEGVTVEVLLDSSIMELIISPKFVRKQKFKLKKKTKRPIYVRNVISFFNKERPIEHTVEVDIYYQEHRKRTEIDVIKGQKQSMILGMLWLACYNLKIDQRIEEVKMTRCPEKCEKQWRPNQGKSGW